MPEFVQRFLPSPNSKSIQDWINKFFEGLIEAALGEIRATLGGAVLDFLRSIWDVWEQILSGGFSLLTLWDTYVSKPWESVLSFLTGKGKVSPTPLGAIFGSMFVSALVTAVIAVVTGGAGLAAVFAKAPGLAKLRGLVGKVADRMPAPVKKLISRDDKVAKAKELADDAPRRLEQIVSASEESERRALFGQRRAGERFDPGKDKSVHTRGRLISEVVDDLRSGKLSPDDLPIEAFEYRGELVSANTRTLAALSEAGMHPTKITIRPPTQQELARLRQDPLIPNAPLPGPRVPITRTFKDRRVLRIVELPGR